MKNLNLLYTTIFLFGIVSISKAQIDPPPPCPPLSTVEFCFENNNDNNLACERTVCLNWTVKPAKLAWWNANMQGCPMPTTICITLAVGQTGCIQIEVPGLPITDWYDLSVSIRSTPTGATPVFELESRFLNSEGTGNDGASYVENGGCQSGWLTYLASDDGYHYIIKSTFTGGTGGN